MWEFACYDLCMFNCPFRALPFFLQNFPSRKLENFIEIEGFHENVDKLLFEKWWG